MARRGMRWGSASYRLASPPAANAPLLSEPLGDVGDNPTRTAHRQRGAELKR
jgi:hypothetical protein